MKLAGVAEVVRSVVESPADVSGTASDVPIVENDAVEGDSQWDLIDLTGKDDRGPSALQRVQDFCRTYGLSVPSYVLSVRELMKDALTAFAQVFHDRASLAELKKSHSVEKANLEKSFAASEERLADTGRRIQAFEYSRDILDDLTTRVDETEAKLKSTEEKVHFLGDKVSEQSNQLVDKEDGLSGYQERVFIL